MAATPAFSSFLLVWLEAEIATNPDFSSAQAIVIPGADFRSGHGEMADRLGPQSVERLLFAVDAFRRLHLPVVVRGGQVSRLRTSLAGMMKTMLEQYFAVPVSWSEERSETTYDNAVFTARLLQKANIRTVVVITQDRDAPRAIWSFERAGFHALAWSAPRTKLDVDQIADFLPNTRALEQTYYALHELMGGLYYRVRYRDATR